MNSLVLNSSLLFPSPVQQSSPCHRSKTQYICSFLNHYGRDLSLSWSLPAFSLRSHQTSIGAAVPSNEGVVSVINFEDLNEKDWSFLDSDESNSLEHMKKIDRIVSAGEINKTSRVLVSIGSEGFVDRVVDSFPFDLLLVVHDSIFVLAGIKEKYDKVKCWQGELIYVPEKWAPLDVVFLYFLPALPFTLDQVFGALANCCLPGARVVISHPQGREVLEQQREQFPDVIISDLPDEMSLQKVAINHSFEIAQFVDEPGLYVTVLKFCKA
ncbi:hypothetical protein ACOSP7_028634 [Xanthoceras sorbifolium]|uniref:Uncharacterized protein n=1 Tax=Xanthoceras sorbifolium TaxID=99658 RepID=A0ABQ8HCN6_9ROSI|nr:hypothetical protein JRO89_XS12G0147100 [Xanthoceras sorbifolium]